jgi:hypothetical protein
MKVFRLDRGQRSWLLFLGGLLIGQLALLGLIQFRFGLSRWFAIIAKVADASDYLASPGPHPTIPIFTDHMPLYSMLIAVGSPVFSPAGAAIVVNVVSFLGFGLVVYSLTRRFWTGIAASFFPYFLFKYSMYVYADIPAFFFAAAGFYFLSKNRSIPSLLFGALAVATHYLTLLLLPGFIYGMYRKRARYAPLGLITSAPFVAMSLFRFFSNGDLLFYVRINFQVWARAGGGQYGLFSYPFASPVYVITHLGALVSHSLALNLFYALFIFFPVYALYMLGAYLAWQEKAFIELSWALPTLFFVTFLSPVGFFYVPRYAIPAFPLLVRAATVGERRKWVQLVIILIVIGNIAYAVGSLLSSPQP